MTIWEGHQWSQNPYDLNLYSTTTPDKSLHHEIRNIITGSRLHNEWQTARMNIVWNCKEGKLHSVAIKSPAAPPTFLAGECFPMRALHNTSANHILRKTVPPVIYICKKNKWIEWALASAMSTTALQGGPPGKCGQQQHWVWLDVVVWQCAMGPQ